MAKSDRGEQRPVEEGSGREQRLRITINLAAPVPMAAVKLTRNGARWKEVEMARSGVNGRRSSGRWKGSAVGNSTSTSSSISPALAARPTRNRAR
ncbi:hypothetical protein GUJ93_ZPchr0004g40478 [Zizania palustris]|uniref:Uncharacterized protein n=1 Tax=Zizania palustris TaxID=103762 RepID=A0A8J5SJ56_ZIZPA|nr:hypothetical protein GUJ93_ZPchr0004g40478 [Zizania palustris]